MTNPFHWQGKPSIFTERSSARDFGVSALNSVKKPTSPPNRTHIHLPGSAPYIKLDGSRGAEFAHIQPPKIHDFEK